MAKERTGEEFKESVAKNKLTELRTRECSFCNYKLGYVFNGDKISIDTGCDCVNYGPVISYTTWDSLASLYNMNLHVPDFIAMMDEKFKFNDKD